MTLGLKVRARGAPGPLFVPSNRIIGITVQKNDGAAIRIRTAAVRNAEKIKKEKITGRFGMYCVTVTE